jgi:hypothetical protein
MASVYAAYKIAGRDLKSLTPHARALRLVSSLVVLAIGAGVIALTILINGAE